LHGKPSAGEAEQSWNHVAYTCVRGILVQSILPPTPWLKKAVHRQSPSVQQRLGPSLQNVPARHSSDEAQPSPWSMGSLTYFVEVLAHSVNLVSTVACSVATCPAHHSVDERLAMDSAAPEAK